MPKKRKLFAKTEKQNTGEYEMAKIKEHYHNEIESGMRKCITLDKEAQDNLPQHIKDKMKADRDKACGSQLIKELPILFSTPMVQAIAVHKNKSQTRRTVGLDEVNQNPDQWTFLGMELHPRIETEINTYKVFEGYFAVFANEQEETNLFVKTRYGQPGDLLWVRETISFYRGFAEDKKPDAPFIYKADKDECGQYPCLLNGETVMVNQREPWKPSIHMPKSAARIWLQNEIVGVERVADISEQDAIAEGVIYDGIGHEWICYDNTTCCFETAKESFRSLWQSINGKPKPSYVKIDGKLDISGYTVFPFDLEAAEQFLNLREISLGYREYKNRPLKIIVNPWVWVVKFKVLSTTGKPAEL